MADDDRPADRERRDSRDTTKLVLMVVLVIVLVAFVIANTDTVNVSFVIADFEVPLIFVLVITAIIGALIDRLLQARRRR